MCSSPSRAARSTHAPEHALGRQSDRTVDLPRSGSTAPGSRSVRRAGRCHRGFPAGPLSESGAVDEQRRRDGRSGSATSTSRWPCCWTRNASSVSIRSSVPYRHRIPRSRARPSTRPAANPRWLPRAGPAPIGKPKNSESHGSGLHLGGHRRGPYQPAIDRRVREQSRGDEPGERSHRSSPARAAGDVVARTRSTRPARSVPASGRLSQITLALAFRTWIASRRGVEDDGVAADPHRGRGRE